MVTSSMTESRLGSLDLHVVGSLSSLNFSSVSRSLGTVGIADNGRRALAPAIGSSRDNSTSLTEGCLGCFQLRSVSRNDGSIGVVDGSRGTLADTSTWSPGIDHRSRGYSIPSWDEVSSSLVESRFDRLDLHVMGSLSSLDCRSISRGDGTIFMADNGRGTLADTSSQTLGIDHRSKRCSIPSWDKVSSSSAESRFGSLDLHVMGSLSSLDCRCISRGDGTIFMAYNGRRVLADTSSRSP